MTAHPQKSILFVHSSNEMYGADRILLQVIKSLPSKQRENVVVWLPDDVEVAQHSLSGELDRLGVSHETLSLPVLRRKYLTLRNLPGLLNRAAKTLRRLRAMRPAIVYVTTSAVLTVAPLARFAAVRRVIFHCQEVWRPKEALVLATMARSATNVVAISESARHSLGRIKPQRIRVILNAVDEPRTASVSRTEDSGPLRFLIASRWNDWKGHNTLLRAWAQANQPGVLVVAGGAPSLGTSTDVHGLVSTLQVAKSVHIVGEVDDLTELIDNADIIVMPSDEPEPFGLVAIEAFARGRAVIASNAGGLADIVADQHTGRLFTPRSVPELATILSELSRADTTRMGGEARQVYLKEYTPQVYTERFEALWTELFSPVN